MKIKVGDIVFVIEKATDRHIFVSWTENEVRKTRWIMHSGYATMFRIKQAS